MSELDRQDVTLLEALLFAVVVLPISMLQGPGIVAITTIVTVGLILYSLKYQNL